MSDFKSLNGYSVKDEYARSEITQMKINFQDGVDTIYNAIVAQGVTPSSSTPSDCAAAITLIGSTQYDNGRSQGRKDVGADISNDITLRDLTVNHYYVVSFICASMDNSVTGISFAGGTILSQKIALRITDSGARRNYKYLGFVVFKATQSSGSLSVVGGSSPIMQMDVIKLGLCQ